MTKRKWVLVMALVALLGLVGVLLAPDSNAPRFEPTRASASGLPTQQVSYDFLHQSPFEGGKMWIMAHSSTNAEVMLYDIENRKIVGRLVNCWPQMLAQGQSKVMATRPVSALRPLDWIRRFLNRMSGGSLNSRSTDAEAQGYWMVDLNYGSSVRMGKLPRPSHFTFFPSPDSRYGCTLLDGQGMVPDLYIMDLVQRSVTKASASGWPSGWWDNNRILCSTTNHDFVLQDVGTHQITPLIRAAEIAEFFRQNQLPDDPGKAQAFCEWDGHENVFYLTDTHQKWLAAEAFLIKVERPDGRLKLLSRRFKFEWSDHFDPTGRYYLHTGRDAGKDSDGVFLRDLETGTNRVLVAGNSGSYFSIPRFYRDSVIYLRSNVLWRINLDGSNNVRLFPP